jgi:hypothetical protein
MFEADFRVAVKVAARRLMALVDTAEYPLSGVVLEEAFDKLRAAYQALGEYLAMFSESGLPR